jgi:methionyl-tRNA formyltransferase
MSITFAFFGTDEFAVTVLETLKSRGLVPSLIVTAPDKPKGRKLILTPPPVKVYAESQNISLVQPEKLNDPIFTEKIQKEEWDLFVVAAYGKIIPESIFNLPKYKTLNIHPSLLPVLRGPSPVATAILKDMRDTGVTIIQIDKEMDHGPIVAQGTAHVDEWVERDVLEKRFAIEGANLLADILPEYMEYKLKIEPQDDTEATYCEMIEKSMGEINLADNPFDNWRKILALHGWPGTFFFHTHTGKKIRVAIRKASFAEGILTIEKVVPEAKKEMSYEDFLRGY